jgi:glutathione S-transferase
MRLNVQKVMWLIGELGPAHELIDAGGPFGGLDTSAFLAMNPHGRIAVIQDGDSIRDGDAIGDGDATVWESHAVPVLWRNRHHAGLVPAKVALARPCQRDSAAKRNGPG